MLLNASSIFSVVFLNYSNNVFGSNIITTLMIFLFFFIIGTLIKIPLAINIALYIPLAIILMTIGFLPIIYGSILVIILMVLSGISLVNSL